MAIDFKKQNKRIDLNPSSADRWTTCTASPGFIFENWDKLPVESKPYADEGTTAHEVAAAMLENREPSLAWCPTAITPEMQQHAFDYWDYIQGLCVEKHLKHIEKKFPLWYMAHRNAKVDVAIINPGHLHIVDYKYGEGIVVSPIENLQGAIYARCVINSLGADIKDDCKITIHIFQPRTREGDTIKVWQTTWGEIKEFTIRIHNASQEILVGGLFPENKLQFVPSEKACQWCPAKGFCHARQAELVKDLAPLAVIDDSPKPIGRMLTETQLAAIVKHGDHIKKWIDDAQAFALQHMLAGGEIPGHKVVQSRGGNRFWTEPDRAAKYLLQDTILRESDIYSEPQLIGPPAVEKLLGKGKFPQKVYGLISKSPGKPMIAPDDDPRENYLVNAAKEFDNLDAKTNLDQF